MIDPDSIDLRSSIGLGVAGNFAGHLEQAGEASDFTHVETESAEAPKGLFPFYIPGDGDHFLHTYPISSDTIRLPGNDADLQIEPEISLLCEIEYTDGDARRVQAIVPRGFAAHNDCSIRVDRARKISEKKNWGRCSKGTSANQIALDGFAPGDTLDRFRIACFLRRDGEIHRYGVDSAATSYSYFHHQLLDWIIGRMNHQADGGPLEDIPNWLERANYPDTALISIGATRYTDFGRNHFLRPGDRSIVAVYDSELFDADRIREIAGDKNANETTGISLLRQKVEPAGD
jgi:hypothetical protein